MRGVESFGLGLTSGLWAGLVASLVYLGLCALDANHAYMVKAQPATTTSPLSSGETELMTRCIGVEPLCSPGQHPVCVCDTDYSVRCFWICTSLGVTTP